MLTGELKSKIDKVWGQFWTGGLSNPITVIEQMTYLLFISRLDDIHTKHEQKAAFLKSQKKKQSLDQTKMSCVLKYITVILPVPLFDKYA